MTSQQTRTLSLAASVALLSLIVTSTPAMAAPVEVWPTEDHAGEIARCIRYEEAINSWDTAATEAGRKGDKKGRDKANRNVKNLVDKATDDGCFVIY